jgi:hypothetical protein
MFSTLVDLKSSELKRREKSRAKEAAKAARVTQQQNEEELNPNVSHITGGGRHQSSHSSIAIL